MSGRQFYCPLDCGLRCYSVMRHINFCKNKSLLGKIYIQCPYNPEHIFKKSIMNIHIHECEDNEQEKDFEEKVSKIQPIRPKKNVNNNNDKEVENFYDIQNEKENENEKEKEKENEKEKEKENEKENENEKKENEN